MSKVQGDIRIGQRAAKEVRKRYNPRIFAKVAGLSNDLIYRWEAGVSPSAYALQAMCELKFDITYILTGRRSL